MSSIAHTPGPWHVHQKWPGYHGIEIQAAEQTSIANLCLNVENAFRGEANANLIVAAPDLLQALEAGQSKDWVANAGITNDIEALRKICLAHADWWNNIAWPLIAKVRGEQ
jgi:hypothetical protein